MELYVSGQIDALMTVRTYSAFAVVGILEVGYAHNLFGKIRRWLIVEWNRDGLHEIDTSRNIDNDFNRDGSKVRKLLGL